MSYYSLREDIAKPSGAGHSYARFLHGMAGMANLDIYVNNELVVADAAYKDFSQYFKALPGEYKITLYMAGTHSRPILEFTTEIAPDMIYTVSVIAVNEGAAIDIVPDTPKSADSNTVYIRVIQYSPDTTELDIYFNGKLKLRNMEYTQATDYLELAAGTYTIKADRAGTSDTVLTVPNMGLKGGRFYAAYVVGLDKGRPGLQLLVPLEGASYLRFN